ncbi:hypothetical protein FACS189485_02920 [Spirochaetia bacterium]|nr:hypothetical protein FACS189485_02920 [Spirochaetia bacterium]
MEDEAAFKTKLAKFLENEGITDAKVREDTDGECPAVASYIKKIADEYFGEKDE